MQKAPFDEKYDDCLIRVHNIVITASFWGLDDKEKITGLALSLLWMHGAEKTKFLGDNEITANITLILRNQNDYSNVILSLSTCSINSLTGRKSDERILLLLSEYLFKKASEYIKETNLKGKNELDFLMPTFHYTEEHFLSKV